MFKDNSAHVYEDPVYVEYFRFYQVQNRGINSSLFNQLGAVCLSFQIPHNFAEIAKAFNQWVFAVETPTNLDDPVIPCYAPVTPPRYLQKSICSMIQSITKLRNHADVYKRYTSKVIDQVAHKWIQVCGLKSQYVNTVRRLWPVPAGQWEDADNQIHVDLSKLKAGSSRSSSSSSTTTKGTIYSSGSVTFTTPFRKEPFVMRGKLYTKLRAAYLSKVSEKIRNATNITDEMKEKYRELDRNRIHSRMLAVYLRYETLIATQKAAGMQGSVPMGAFHVLRDHLGVNGECFASPLNQTLLYLDTKDGGGGSGGGSGQTFSFCSAFKDTDHWFGSKGSFFSSSFIDHLKTHGGHYEANPPFGKNEMCFSKMLQLMVNALIVTSKAGMTSDGKVVPPRPLSFCIISPTNNFDLSLLIRAMRENKKKMDSLTKTSQKGR